MSLSPLSVAKRRRSMDPSILKTTPEGEEDQTNDADRKGSAQTDPSSLTLPFGRRIGETRSSCFDLDLKTIRALQEKAHKAIANDSQKDENDKGDESSSSDNASDDDHDSDNDDDDDDDDEITDLNGTLSKEPENPRRGSDISNLVNRESCSSERPRASTYSGETSRQRRIAHVSINLGNTSKTDFKPVSFSFNTDELGRNDRLISESVTTQNAQFKTNDSQQDSTTKAGNRYKDTEDASLSTKSVDEDREDSFKPQKLTLQFDKLVVNDKPTNSTRSHDEELPTICVNDELFLSSPPPTSLNFNNNIEKMDRQDLTTTQPLLQNSSNKNIANVSIIPDGVQAITVQLGNLNGLQLNPKQVSCSVSRSSTESAPC